MPDVQIRFKADSNAAKREISQLQREVKGLQQGLGQAGQAADALSNDARKAAVGVTSLGRQIFATSAEARKFNGVFVDSIGKIREADGRYAKAGETVDKLGTTFRRTTPQIKQFDESLQQSHRSTGILTGGLGSLRNVLGGIGIAVVTHQLGQLAISSVQAAGSLEQLTRATTQIEGSAEAAEERIDALIQVANLPGLQFEPLVRYSNRLRAAGIEGQDVDTILLSVGQTIVSLGGSAATAELAMEQLIQAIAAGKVDMRDFRTIIQQIPGFLEAMGDVHGVEANIDGLKEAFDRTGGSIRDLVIPTFEELSRRFEAPPTDSYIVAMDTLENAFRLAQASIGGLFLPTIVEASQGLTAFFEAIRAGVDDVTTLPEPIQEIVRGAMALYEALQNVGESIGSVISPPVQELASQLANLIGEVLGLVGAIYNSLEPVFKGLYAVIGTVVAAVAQLVEHISLLVGGLTTAVNWVTQFWTEEERAAVSTNKLAAATEQLAEAQEKLNTSGDGQRAKLKGLQTELDETSTRIERYEESLRKAEDANNTRDIEFYERRLKLARERVAELSAEIATLTERYGGASAALGENATAAEQNVARLKDLQTELEGVNSRLAEKQARFDELIEKGANPAHASMQQLTRQINALKAESESLNTEIGNTTTQLEASESSIDEATGSAENYSLALAKLKANAEDTREALSDTVDIQQLGANYSAAIAASDAYYAVQIANAEAALAQEEVNSQAYQQIETDLFNLRRDQLQARERLTQQAAAVGEAESQKRIQTAEAESEALQKAGEETERALTESQKQQTEAAEAEQKRLTEAHEAGLKTREAAQQASDQRLVQNSQEQLAILQDNFQNISTQGVDAAYSTIQQATIEHYEILKSQARQRITDEDALTAELVSLDRQRNAELQDNHRAYLQRIASDAKDLLGDRTDAFRENSAEILHDWDRTISEFERRLREADTEDAIQQIESEFTEAQQQMLASLTDVLTELGFTAEQAAEIMTEVFRTAETESDGFADKVISAFKRLGREADRETKRQNREVERSYREMVRDIENILGSITDFFFDIANDGDIEQAFRDLGSRLGNAVLDEFQQQLAGQIASTITSEVTAGTGAGGTGAGAAGLGSGLAALGSALLPMIPILTAIATTGLLIYGTVQKIQTRSENAGDGEGAPSRRPDPDAEGGVPSRRRDTTAGGGVPSRRPVGQQDGIEEIDTIVEATIEQTVEAFGGFYGIILSQLQESLDQASFNLDFANLTGEGIDEAVQGVIAAQTEFYQHQIDEINRVRRETGNLSFGNAEELIRQLNALNNDARSQLENISNVTRFTPRTERGRTPGSRYNASLGIYEQIPTVGSESLAPVGSQDPTATPEAPEPETVAEDVLASVIQAINEDVQLINASITGIETQIDQASEPDEIAALLDQLPALISEKYQRLRDALSERYYAGEITEDVYSASISELESSESAELEQQSDAVLANTLRSINEDVQLIDASIQSIQTQIDQLSEPEAIAELLSQIPALLTEKYRGLRESLDAKYAAGEISTDVYNASLTQINSSESAELEQQSDALLATVLSSIDDDVALIDAEIGALQLAVSQSDDPEAVAGLLDAIKILVADKYKRLRERLDEVYAAEEISTDAYNAALLGLSTAETQALAGIDTQALNTISAEAQDRVNFVNGAIENLRLSLQLTDDPAEIQSILDAIKVLTSARFDALRNELEAIRDTLKPEEYQQALDGLNLGEQLALENLDTEKFDAVSEAAAEQVAFINGSIENLRLAIQLTDDPGEQQQILDAIKVLVMARFDVLREELEKIRESLKPEEYEQALKGLNLGEQLSLQNLDTEKFDLISQEAQQQVGLINGAIENLRLSIQLTDDPTESQQILDAIKILTAARFDVLIQELKDIQANLDPEEFEQALQGLELGKAVALDAIDTEKFGIISAEAQRQVNFINGSIENLRLSLQLTDDPAEMQQILDAIKILTRARFDALRQELEAIRENLTDAEYTQALRGLNLGEQVALKNLDAEKFSAISAEAQKSVRFIEGAIDNLRLSLQLTNDPSEIQQILEAIKILVGARFDVLIQELNAIKDTLDPAEFNQALTGLQLGRQVAIKGIDGEALGNTLNQINTDAELINNQVNSLSDEIRNSDDPQEIANLAVDLREAIMERYRLQREVLQKQLNAEELTIQQYNAELGSINRAETTALIGADRLASDEISNLRTSANNLIENAIQRGEFRLGQATSEQDFETTRAQLLQLTNTYYDNEELRISNLVGSETELQNLREDNSLARERALQRIDNLDNEFTQERIRREEETAAEIERIQQEALARQQRREQQAEANQLGAFRSEQDLNLRASRSIEDSLLGAAQSLIGDSPFQGEDRFRNPFTGEVEYNAIREVADEIRQQFTENPNYNIDFSEFGLDPTSDYAQQINQFLNVDFSRRLEDIDIESSRDEFDLLQVIAQEGENNQWKDDIATIAANTALEREPLDPLRLEDRREPLDKPLIELPEQETPGEDTLLPEPNLDILNGVSQWLSDLRAASENFEPAIANMQTLTGSIEYLFNTAVEAVDIDIDIRGGVDDLLYTAEQSEIFVDLLEPLPLTMDNIVESVSSSSQSAGEAAILAAEAAQQAVAALRQARAAANTIQSLSQRLQRESGELNITLNVDGKQVAAAIDPAVSQLGASGGLQGGLGGGGNDDGGVR